MPTTEAYDIFRADHPHWLWERTPAADPWPPGGSYTGLRRRRSWADQVADVLEEECALARRRLRMARWIWHITLLRLTT